MTASNKKMFRPGLENLEKREVMSVTSVTLEGAGVLRIVCDGANDDVRISQVGTTVLVVDAATPSGQVRGFQAAQVRSVEFRGNDGNDALTMGAAIPLIAFGGKGDDTIRGSAAIDQIFGEMGNDRIYGGAGNDYIDGGMGADTIYGEEGDDELRGGWMGNGNAQDQDVIFGGAGNDVIYGGGGDDALNGGAGKDVIHGEDGNDYIRGGDDGDATYGLNDADSVYGGRGNDTIVGGAGDDNLDGGIGADIVYGDDGNDIVRGGWVGNEDAIDHDRLYGGRGNDTLYGGGGDDQMYGGDGNDKILGELGNDTAFGGADNDHIDGGMGADTIYGEEGNDEIRGGWMGNGDAQDNDVIYGGIGDDVIYGGGGDDSLYGGAGKDVIHGEDGFDTIRGGDDGDQRYGLNDADTVYGGRGNDTIYGGAGRDVLDGGVGSDRVYGGAGDDIVRGGWVGSDDAADIDFLFGESGNDVLYGGGGRDWIDGGADSDCLFGETGNDVLIGGSGIDSLWGGDGDDWMEAGSANETAFGGSGVNWNAHAWVVQGPSADDVKQFEAPTCSFLASVSSVTRTGVNLPARIAYLGNFRYSVPLFDGSRWKTQIVTFDGSTTNADPLSAQSGEFWTIIYQRAYIQMVGGDGQSWPDRALTALTGRPTQSVVRTINDGDFNTLNDALSRGRNVVVATNSFAWSRSGVLVGNDAWTHAYTVTEIRRDSLGRPVSVTVRNPWGTDRGSLGALDKENDGYITVHWSTFKACMQGFWIN
jgi:Ca2+-binding RTX toxin-like protein